MTTCAPSPNLFTPLERPSIQQAFEAFDRANPKIYALFVHYADLARQAGCERYSADAILHRLRWHLTVETQSSGDGFKLNNNHASRYARKLIRDRPEFAGFFELRELQS